MEQHAAQRPAKALITRPGAVRDAGVDHGNARSAGMREAQKVWPEFSFGKDDEFGLQRLQIRTNGKGKVQREVKNIFRAETFAGEFLTGVSGGGYDDAGGGKIAAHLLDQPADGEHLANRNGVDPDDTLGAGIGALHKPRRNAAGTLRKSAVIFAVAHDVIKPIRQAYQQGSAQHQAVEKIAQAGDILNRGGAARPWCSYNYRLCGVLLGWSTVVGSSLQFSLQRASHYLCRWLSRARVL